MQAGKLERIDWNRLSDEELERLESELKAELSPKEQRDIDIRTWGAFVLFKAKSLSLKVNREILDPLAEWLQDPDLLKRYEIRDERVIDWAGLKREQRQYDRMAQIERLRLYWKKVRQRRELLSKLAGIGPSKGASEDLHTHDSGDGFLGEFLGPFSRDGQAEHVLEQEFARLMDRDEVHRIPWRQLMLIEIGKKETLKLGDLATHTSSSRVEFVAKLSTLLQLETEGVVEILQEQPFEDPSLSVIGEPETVFRIKDRSGQTRTIEASILDDAERLSVIEQAKNGEIICV